MTWTVREMFDSPKGGSNYGTRRREIGKPYLPVDRLDPPQENRRRS